MRYKELRPIQEWPSDYEALVEELSRVFREALYLPLIKEIGLPSKTLKNSTDDLLQAIRSSRIWFYRGLFKGKFSAAVSRELKKIGATWSRKDEAFSIPMSELSVEIRQAITLSEDRMSRTLAAIDRRLSAFLPENITDKLRIENIFSTTIWRLDRRVKASLKDLSVQPVLTKEQRAAIAREYTKNMELYITDWTAKEIINLREKMQTRFMAGQRYEGMVKTIQSSYGVSRSKAKFLARQETGILTAKFTASRFTDAGITHYKWRCVTGTKEHPVRPMHKELNDRSLKGEVFEFKRPPIDSPDGSRHNPKENYNCRCQAIPVVKFEKKDSKSSG